MKTQLTAKLATILLVGGAMLTYGQTNPDVTPEMRREANTMFQAQDWTKAAEAYERIVSIEPANANANYRLGFSLLNLNKNIESQKYLEKALTTAPNANFALALARAFARTNNKTKAYEVLENGTTLGGFTPESLAAEKEFFAWKDEAQFKDILRKLDIATYPCKANAEFRQFDFWIGDWEVRTPQGQLAGSSTIQSILGQCIIFENWSGLGGGNGKSFNLYDSNDKKWHQTWVDDKGTLTHYIGGLQDGKMVVVADTIIAGKKTLAKMTFSKLPNGDVRQFGENSIDAGRAWTTAFDLIYSRKK